MKLMYHNALANEKSAKKRLGLRNVVGICNFLSIQKPLYFENISLF